MIHSRQQEKMSHNSAVCLLGESDLQVWGEVLSWCERVLPNNQVRNIVDGEAEFR